jgi:aldehyde dehydrogenase (NAD+)
MIDMCDYAVGLSRQLYGLTIASERANHRMLEQWHPLGPVGIVTAFNFPVAVWAWNAMLAAVCGDTCIWKPSHLTPLTAIAVQNIVDEVVRPLGIRRLRLLGADVGNDTEDSRLPSSPPPAARRWGWAKVRSMGRSLLELAEKWPDTY